MAKSAPVKQYRRPGVTGDWRHGNELVAAGFSLRCPVLLSISASNGAIVVLADGSALRLAASNRPVKGVHSHFAIKRYQLAVSVDGK